MLIFASRARRVLAILWLARIGSACSDRPALADSAAASAHRAGVPQRAAAASAPDSTRVVISAAPAPTASDRACDGNGRALPPLLDSAARGEENALDDTGLGLLVHREYHRDGKLFHGPWNQGEYTPPRTMSTVTVRSSPAMDAPPVALFQLWGGEPGIPECQFVVPVESEAPPAESDTLYRAAVSPMEGGWPAALIVDSVGPDPRWVRVIYGRNAARAIRTGWVRLEESGAGFVPWPRILFPAGRVDSIPVQSLLFRRPPTRAQLGSLLRVAPDGAPARLSMPPNFDPAELYMDVAEVRGDWVRVRLYRGQPCGSDDRALVGAGWLRVVDARGRTNLEHLDDSGCESE